MVTLVLNSPSIDRAMLRKLAARSVLIGVDGGLNAIREAGLVPHWAVGDFDSVRPELLAQLPGRTRLVRCPVEKDFTDLELALKLALACRPKEIYVLGLGGGLRFDHQVVNTLMLAAVAAAGCKITAWHGAQKLVFTDSAVLLRAKHGRMFSVFSLEGAVCVNIYGAKYSGADIVLRPGSGYGLGNEIKGSRAAVAVKRGVAVICQWGTHSGLLHSMEA